MSIDDPTRGEHLLTSSNLQLSDDLELLYQYLKYERKILDLTGVKTDWLYINSRRVLSMIQRGDSGWEKMVPRYIEHQIKSKQLFGYKMES